MEWIARLNSAINYIEENITEELDYEQIAVKPFGHPSGTLALP